MRVCLSQVVDADAGDGVSRLGVWYGCQQVSCGRSLEPRPGLVVCAAGMDAQNGERNPDGCAEVCFPWSDQPVVRTTAMAPEGSPSFIGGRTQRPHRFTLDVIQSR